MWRKRQISSMIAAVFCMLFFSVSGLSASWQKIADLGVRVGCCFFEDDNYGFAGTGTYNQSLKLEIWHTIDGGASWSKTTVPNGTGQVTQISIRPDGVGFASIFSQANPAMNLWKTTDNGNSWVDASSGGRFGTGAGISTVKQGFASWDPSGAPNNSTNGVFFMDPSTMLITPGRFPAPPLDEAWSAYGDPVSRVWYAVFELSRKLLISTDGGVSWKLAFDFGNKLVTGAKSLTGHIVGAGGALYVQSDTGIFKGSLNDRGVTWSAIFGSPSNFQDTRTMYAGGCYGELIIAFDETGGVWKSTDGGDGMGGGQPPISFTHPKFQSISSCKSYSRKLFFTNLYCYDYVVTKISFDNPNAAFSLQLPPLPDTLHTDRTDSFQVVFDPARKPGNYSVNVRIRGYHITNGGNKYLDSVIVLTATANPEAPQFVITPTKINFYTVSICGGVRDTFFTMRNTGCDTLTITSGPGTLIPEFTIDPLALPYRLPPDSTIILHCKFKPTTLGAKQDYPSYQATQQGLSKSIGMILDGFGEDGAGILSFQPSSFRFDTLSICSSADSSEGFLTNTGCIPLTIGNFTLSGDPDFTLLGANPTNTSIKPGDTVRFGFKFAPKLKGNRTAGISIRSKNTSGTGTSKDNSLSLVGFVGSGTKLLSAMPAAIDFGTTTLCEERDSVITFFNKGCDTLIITAADIGGKGFTVSTSLPIILMPGSNTKIPITTIVDTTGGSLVMNGSLSITSTADNTLSPITFTRSVTLSSKKTIDFGIVSKPFAAPSIGTAGDVVRFALKESATLPITGSGVKSLEFDLGYNSDLLQYIDRQQGASTLTSADGKHFVLSGSPFITADANRELAEMFFEVFLTKDSTTTLTISKVTFPQDSGSQRPCASSIKATASGSSYSYSYVCADHALQDFMRFDKIRITSIIPNPARDEIHIEVISPTAVQSGLEIYDALGKRILQKNVELLVGKNDVSVKINQLTEGSFTLRLSTETGVVSRQFVRVK